MNVKTLLCGCALVMGTAGSLLASDREALGGEKPDDWLRSSSCAVVSAAPPATGDESEEEEEDLLAAFKRNAHQCMNGCNSVLAFLTVIKRNAHQCMNGCNSVLAFLTAMKAEALEANPDPSSADTREISSDLTFLRETLYALLDQIGTIQLALQAVKAPAAEQKELASLPEQAPRGSGGWDNACSPQPGERSGIPWGELGDVTDLFQEPTDKGAVPPPPAS